MKCKCGKIISIIDADQNSPLWWGICLACAKEEGEEE